MDSTTIKRIGYAQFAPEFGNGDLNRKVITRFTEAAQAADLLVFPELCVSGYDFIDKDELGDLAEPFDNGPTSELALELAEKYSITLVIGYPERDGEKFYNSCLLAQPGGKIVNYRKIHLFSKETTLFTPGDKPPTVVETPAGRVGMMICFDWVYPETARVLSIKGAQILAHPSNLVLQFCQRAMFARSVENAVYSITCNRYGTEERTDRSLTFTGYSQVLDPKGELLMQARSDEHHVGIVEVDIAKADNKWMTEYNHLFEGRRTDVYEGLM